MIIQVFWSHMIVLCKKRDLNVRCHLLKIKYGAVKALCQVLCQWCLVTRHTKTKNLTWHYNLCKIFSGKQSKYSSSHKAIIWLQKTFNIVVWTTFMMFMVLFVHFGELNERFYRNSPSVSTETNDIRINKWWWHFSGELFLWAVGVLANVQHLEEWSLDTSVH